MAASEVSRRPLARRTTMALLLVVTICAGLIVHRWMPDSDVSDVSGDVLYALAAYCGIGALVPRLRPLAVAVIAAAWCVGVELFQLTGLPERLGATFPPAVLLLGTVFDPRDLLCYLAATAGSLLVDAAVVTARAASRRDASSGATPP